ncbi:hypothetical protein [Amycolatopsis sp. GM8]|uniref:hypothetical protein n=1 Tax=Amycolatopsis sp. GM8 TaxID=2896530 RepID=UPI001F1B049E|nr:hypothetical protein [Amycolatopsis sp. GM8]
MITPKGGSFYGDNRRKITFSLEPVVIGSGSHYETDGFSVTNDRRFLFTGEYGVQEVDPSNGSSMMLLKLSDCTSTAYAEPGGSIVALRGHDGRSVVPPPRRGIATVRWNPLESILSIAACGVAGSKLTRDIDGNIWLFCPGTSSLFYSKPPSIERIGKEPGNQNLLDITCKAKVADVCPMGATSVFVTTSGNGYALVDLSDTGSPSGAEIVSSPSDLYTSAVAALDEQRVAILARNKYGNGWCFYIFNTVTHRRSDIVELTGLADITDIEVAGEGEILLRCITYGVSPRSTVWKVTLSD